MLHDKQPPRDPDDRTVSLSTKDVHDAARLLSKLMGNQTDVTTLERLLLAAKRDSADFDESQEQIDRFALVSAARDLFRERRHRTRFFLEEMFGEPAWDMLLALYINHITGERLTVSRLLRFAGAPETTALRWLKFLVKRELVIREGHPNDARVVLIHLTSETRRALDVYLSETLRARR